jgi:hypothetical protein
MCYVSMLSFILFFFLNMQESFIFDLQWYRFITSFFALWRCHVQYRCCSACWDICWVEMSNEGWMKVAGVYFI